jgi:hypothetical protein
MNGHVAMRTVTSAAAGKDLQVFKVFIEVSKSSLTKSFVVLLFRVQPKTAIPRKRKTYGFLIVLRLDSGTVEVA